MFPVTVVPCRIPLSIVCTNKFEVDTHFLANIKFRDNRMQLFINMFFVVNRIIIVYLYYLHISPELRAFSWACANACNSSHFTLAVTVR